MIRFWTTAPTRKRRRRVQKKIDRRYGAQHCPPRSVAQHPFFGKPSSSPLDFHVLSCRRNVKRAPNRWSALLWFEQSFRVVAKSWVGDVEISTVFLGINHNLFGPGEWFETMVFGSPLDKRQKRYTTWGEAVDGHAQVLAEVQMEARSSRAEPSSQLH